MVRQAGPFRIEISRRLARGAWPDGPFVDFNYTAAGFRHPER
jgi:hypothetical protein